MCAKLRATERTGQIKTRRPMIRCADDLPAVTHAMLFARFDEVTKSHVLARAANTHTQFRQESDVELVAEG